MLLETPLGVEDQDGRVYLPGMGTDFHGDQTRLRIALRLGVAHIFHHQDIKIRTTYGEIQTAPHGLVQCFSDIHFAYRSMVPVPFPISAITLSGTEH